MARPTKYKKEYCEMLVDHMKGGLSFECFGGVIEVDQDTLHKWAKRYKEFNEAKKKGTTLSMLWWERIGRAGMLDQPFKGPDGKLERVKKFNTAIWIFNMKNRFKWRDIELPKVPVENGKEKAKARKVMEEVNFMLEDLKRGKELEK